MLKPYVLMLFAAICLTASGQDKVSRQVQVKQGTVVYVSGNDLIVKLQDGTLKHFVVPDNYMFHIDGHDTTIKSLQPGTKLTQRVTTTTKETTVTKVQNVDAKVVLVNPPYLTVDLADGTRKTVKVPEGTTFTVEGQSQMLSALKAGMQLKGTIVTDTPQTVVSTSSKVSGKAPRIDPPAIIGVLLIEEVPVP